MSRSSDATFLAATKAEIVRPVLLCEMDWPSGISYACSAPFNVVAPGSDGTNHTFLGVGSFGSVSGGREGTDSQSDQMTLNLSGLDPSLLALVANENNVNRPVFLWLALVDEAWALVGSPNLRFAGLMDAAEIKIGATGEISLPVTNRLADWERPRGGNWTDSDQQKRFGGDKFFEFVAQLVDATILWGRT